jgi:hypothetical protein
MGIMSVAQLRQAEERRQCTLTRNHSIGNTHAALSLLLVYAYVILQCTVGSGTSRLATAVCGSSSAVLLRLCERRCKLLRAS